MKSSRKFNQFAHRFLKTPMSTGFTSYMEVLAQLFVQQCKVIASQRLFRAVRKNELYNRLYGKSNAYKTLNLLRKTTKSTRKPFGMMLGCAVFSWESEKISDANMRCVCDEIYQVKDYIEKSKEVRSTLAQDCVLSDWEKVMEDENLKIWKQPIANSHLYEYKVFGSFKDITARDFYDVQVDLSYRREWDNLVIDIDVVDRDPLSGTEVVRWLTHYPYPMYSREYIYCRRYKVDYERKLMVTMAQAVSHPQCPVDDNYVRVSTYKSHMVIKPHTKFDEAGMDYLLTYYDDPRSHVPSLAWKWVAASGLPRFVNNLHNAALALHDHKLRRHTQGNDAHQSAMAI